VSRWSARNEVRTNDLDADERQLTIGPEAVKLDGVKSTTAVLGTAVLGFHARCKVKTEQRETVGVLAMGKRLRRLAALKRQEVQVIRGNR
jgi:hypothetical protein